MSYKINLLKPLPHFSGVIKPLPYFAGVSELTLVFVLKSLEQPEICICKSSHPITVMSHEHDGVSNQCQLACLFNSLFRLTTKETFKLCSTGHLCKGNPLVTGGSPHKAQQHIFTHWFFNSLWPSDAIRWHRSGSTLAQVMACCLTAPSHYLTQCPLIITKVQLHASENNFMRDTSAICE